MSKSVTLYTLEELSNFPNKRAFEKAVEELEMEDCWYEQVTEEWEEFLVQIGFEKPEVMFGSLHTQGSGACFTSKRINFEKLINFKRTDDNYLIKRFTEDTLLDSKFAVLAEETYLDFMSGKVVHNDRYYHEGSCDIEAEELFYQLDHSQEELKHLEKLFQELIKDIEEIRRKICLEIFKDLLETYDEMNTAEYILQRESESDCPLFFTEKGNLWVG